MSRRSERFLQPAPPRRSERIIFRHRQVGASLAAIPGPSRAIARTRGRARSPASARSGIQRAPHVPSSAPPRPIRLQVIRDQIIEIAENEYTTRSRSLSPEAGPSADTEDVPAEMPLNMVPETEPQPEPESDSDSDSEDVINSRGTAGRLARELKDFNSDPLEGCKVELIKDNIFFWKATIPGPLETPYEGGIFELELKFDNEYPFKPPGVQFLTRIYHCNLAMSGNICVDILGAEWSPALTVSKLLLSIISLLADPNPNDPLDARIGQLFLNDPDQYAENARKWTDQHAIPKEKEEKEKESA